MKYQLFAAALMFMLASLNQKRERKMINAGATTSQRNIFHDICGAAKVFFAFLVLYYSEWDWILAGVFLFTEWFCFDIFNALMIGQKWYYIGTSAWLDIQVRKLGPDAGEIKAVACAVIVIVLTILHKST